MDNFCNVSESRRSDVLKRCYVVYLVDRCDPSKKMRFNCGSDLVFFLSFVDWNSYFVEVHDLCSDYDFSDFGVVPQK